MSASSGCSCKHQEAQRQTLRTNFDHSSHAVGVASGGATPTSLLPFPLMWMGGGVTTLRFFICLA